MSAYKRITKKREYRFQLSSDDSGIPDDYLSITEIFTNPKCALPGFSADTWCIGEKRLKDMRRKCFENTLLRLRTSKAERFDKYWNGNIDAINQLGLNEFAKLSFFSDLASVMMAFENRVKTKYVDISSKHKVISFGIRKTLYRKYYDSLAVALKTGQDPKPVNLYDPKKKRRNDVFYNTQQTTIVFDGPDGGKPHYVELNKNEVFLAYEKWCKLNGITKKQGLYNAMLLMMKEFPIKDMDSLEEIRAFKKYHKYKDNIRTEEIVVRSNDPSEWSSIKIKLPMSVKDKIENIIKLYNHDLSNVWKKNMTLSSFGLQALVYYIKNIPLKYSDPQAYHEYMEVKDAEEYNKTL